MQDMRTWLEQNDIYQKEAERLFHEAEAVITNPLLHLYTEPNQKKMSEYQNTIMKIDIQLRTIERMRKKLKLFQSTLDKTYIEKHFASVPIQYLKFLDQELEVQWHQLEVTRLLRAILLQREKKHLFPALNDVNKAIEFMDHYEQLLKMPKEIESKNSESFKRLKVNLYNHKAKIYRALAGRNLKKSKLSELNNCKESYQKALEIESDNETIIGSIGFLLIDRSESTEDVSEREKLLDEAYKIFKKILETNPRDSFSCHGMGFVLYHQQKLKQDKQEAIDVKILKRALEEFKEVNPSSRLDRDKALIYILLNDDEKALESLNEGYKKEPRDCLVLFDRGRLRIKLKDFNGAQMDLEAGRDFYHYAPDLAELFEEQLQILEQEKQNAKSPSCGL